MNVANFLAMLKGPDSDRAVVEAWQQLNRLSDSELGLISAVVARHRPHLYCDLFESKL